MSAVGRSPDANGPGPGMDLMARHGELMDGRALAALFKFGSDRSFRRSANKGALPVSVFRLPGRRGWFARTHEVVSWLSSTGRPG